MAAKLLSLLMVFLSLGQNVLAGYEEEMNIGGNLFLVNRDYTLASDYVPPDLVHPDVRTTDQECLLRADAAHARFSLALIFAAERGRISAL